MVDLMAELTDEEFAASNNKTHITSCKVKKDDMSMNVEIFCEEFPCVMPIEEFKERVFQKFGVKKINLSFKYDNFKLTTENEEQFYSCICEIVCSEKQSLSNILTGSTAKILDDVLEISLRFGGEKTLTDQKVNEYIENIIYTTFNKSIKVIFKDNEKDENDLLKRL